MPRKLQIAENNVIQFFKTSDQKVFSRAEMKKIVSQNRAEWKIATEVSATQFIELLKEWGLFREYQFSFPSRNDVRYVLGETQEYLLIQSLRPKSYFTHATALSLHQLTTDSSKIIYLNYEQRQNKNPKNTLTQESIDLAFQSSCRISNNIAKLNEKSICLLNGMFTGQLGVVSFHLDDANCVQVTGLERTLIDCTVRPVYAGGVHTVLEAFKRASGRISISNLAKILTMLDYTYPFHQAIGFYLEQSGSYSGDQIAPIERIPRYFDFYLTHQMQDMKYSKRWRLYLPVSM